MKRKVSLIVAILLIFVSFFCISYGVYYSFNEKKNLPSDVNITTDATIEGQKDDINVTIKDSDTTSNSSVDTQNQNTVVSPDTNSNNSSNNSTNGSSNSGEVSTDLNVVNNNLRNNIQEKYGINVKYGEELNNYSVGDLSTVIVTDNVTINSSLSKLNYDLSLYPSNFFKEFNKKGLSLSIYLIKRYSLDNVTGITDSTNKNVIISIATDYSFSESLHHEIYHYIENYIYLNGGSYSTWNQLNPGDFNYGSANYQLAYTKTNRADSYFVNMYAMESEFEDRASTFEYMMATDKISCLNYGNTIYLKANYMSNLIDLFFDTVSPNTLEYWERHLVS